MKNLAIDTSSEVCGVALLEDDKLIDDNSLNNGKTHSENLMILVKEILERNNLKLEDIDLISCNIGPGSFTGIRIGISSVKALSEANNIKVAPVTSLEILAKGVEGDYIKVALIDARNDQVYAGIFNKDYDLLEEYIADSIENALEKISHYKNICFCGNGAEKYRDYLGKILDISFSNEILQEAVNAGKIGYQKFVEGKTVSADRLLPLYLKRPQAERLAKNGNS